MWFHQYGSHVYLQSFIFTWGFLSLLSIKEGKVDRLGLRTPILWLTLL